MRRTKKSTRKQQPKKATDLQLVPIIKSVAKESKGKVVPFRLLKAIRAAGYKADTERAVRLLRQIRAGKKIAA